MRLHEEVASQLVNITDTIRFQSFIHKWEKDSGVTHNRFRTHPFHVHTASLRNKGVVVYFYSIKKEKILSLCSVSMNKTSVKEDLHMVSCLLNNHVHA